MKRLNVTIIFLLTIFILSFTTKAQENKQAEENPPTLKITG